MSEQLLIETDTKMNKTIDALKKDYSAVRTGKASNSLVENIIVEYYGSNTPISNLATISVPEAQLIVIQPWDREAIISIEKDCKNQIWDLILLMMVQSSGSLFHP